MWRLLFFTTVLVAVGADVPAPLKVVWWQDMEQITMELQAACLIDPNQVSWGRDNFTIAGCTEQPIVLVLRENVDGSSAECRKTSVAVNLVVVCTVPKVPRGHLFDQLWADEGNPLVTTLVNWERHMSYEDEDDAEELYSAKVPKVDATTLALWLEQHDAVVLDVRFPWCVKCTRVTQMVTTLKARLAKALPRFTVGWVDARQERQLRHELEAACTDECFLHVLRKDEPVSFVRVESKVSDLVKDLKALGQHSVFELTSSEAVQKFLHGQRQPLIGFLNRSSEYFKRLEDFAVDVDNRKMVTVGYHASGLVPDYHVNEAVLRLKDGTEMRLDLSSNSWEHRVALAMHGPLVSFDWMTRDFLSARHHAPLLQVFYNAEQPADSQLAVVKAVAKQYLGEVVCMAMPLNVTNHMLVEAGLQQSDKPPLYVLARFQLKEGKEFEGMAERARLNETRLKL